MKFNNCFDCLHHGERERGEPYGFYYSCKLNIENNGLEDTKSCPSYSMNQGFQIGGYYSHIHFECNEEVPNECMEMIIHSDGEFPTEDTEKQIKFHICDFRQLEYFVKVWGDYLRKKGVIDDDAE